MTLGAILVLISVGFAAACALGASLCREIMLEEVQRRLPEQQKIRHPYLSWKIFEIIRLHEQYYPESRIRAVNRFLIYLFVMTMGSIAIVGFVFAFSKQLAR